MAQFVAIKLIYPGFLKAEKKKKKSFQDTMLLGVE